MIQILNRTFLAGLLAAVLLPCACAQAIERLPGASSACHGEDPGCCGTQGGDLHALMDRDALPTAQDHAKPSLPDFSLAAALVPSTASAAALPPAQAGALSGESPPHLTTQTTVLRI